MGNWYDDNNEFAPWEMRDILNNTKKKENKMLTYEDYNTLIEAMEAWEKSAMQDHLMTGMFGIMLAKDKEEAHKRTEDMKRNMDNTSNRSRKEKALLLKAKLIQIRDEVMIKELEG